MNKNPLSYKISRIPVQPTFKGKFVPFFCPRTFASYVNDDAILQPAADDVGGGGSSPSAISEEEQFQEEHNSAAFTCRTTSTNVAE